MLNRLTRIFTSLSQKYLPDAFVFALILTIVVFLAGIIIEDKTDPEKNMTYEFQSNEIFKASDVMVDALTKLLDNERNKRKVN